MNFRNNKTRSAQRYSTFLTQKIFCESYSPSPATHSSSGIHGSAVSEQDADDVRLVGAGSQVEGSLSSDRSEVGVSVVLDQVDHNVHVTHEGSNMERGQSRLQERINTFTVENREWLYDSSNAIKQSIYKLYSFY